MATGCFASTHWPLKSEAVLGRVDGVVRHPRLPVPTGCSCMSFPRPPGLENPRASKAGGLLAPALPPCCVAPHSHGGQTLGVLSQVGVLS